MIPPPTSEKDDPKSKTRYEAIASGQAQGLNGDPYYGYRDDLYEHVSTQLARFGTPVDGARINLVKGLFEETLPSLDIERIAFAHLASDWYEPVRSCLDDTSRRLRSETPRLGNEGVGPCSTVCTRTQKKKKN